MIDEKEINFVLCYERTCDELYENNYLKNIDGLGGVIKAVIEVAADYNFEQEDIKVLVDHFISEIYS